MRRADTPTYPRYHKPWDLEPHYSRHVGAMTSEGLHEKADIAFQLALRDKRIAELIAQIGGAPPRPLHLDHVVTGAIAFLREAWRNNDGAEGESVRVVCDELEHLRGLVRDGA